MAGEAMRSGIIQSGIALDLTRRAASRAVVGAVRIQDQEGPWIVRVAYELARPLRGADAFTVANLPLAWIQWREGDYGSYQRSWQSGYPIVRDWAQQFESRSLDVSIELREQVGPFESASIVVWVHRGTLAMYRQAGMITATTDNAAARALIVAGADLAIPSRATELRLAVPTSLVSGGALAAVPAPLEVRQVGPDGADVQVDTVAAALGERLIALHPDARWIYAIRGALADATPIPVVWSMHA